MTVNKIVVGYKNSDQGQTDSLSNVLEFLDDVEPIDALMGENVPENVDFYSLIDFLSEIVNKAKLAKNKLQDHEQRLDALES